MMNRSNILANKFYALTIIFFTVISLALLWLSAEPYCIYCLSSKRVTADLSCVDLLKNMPPIVQSFHCFGCKRSWIPMINLHRFIKVGCRDGYR